VVVISLSTVTTLVAVDRVLLRSGKIDWEYNVFYTSFRNKKRFIVDLYFRVTPLINHDDYLFSSSNIDE
jgi:hypothetical protein